MLVKRERRYVRITMLTWSSGLGREFERRLILGQRAVRLALQPGRLGFEEYRRVYVQNVGQPVYSPNALAVDARADMFRTGQGRRIPIFRLVHPKLLHD